jgi:PAS domain S-box-containing protein
MPLKMTTIQKVRRQKISMAVLISVLFSVLSIFSSPVHASYPDFLSPEERQWLQEHDGKIRVAPDPYYPPLEYFDEKGIFKGIAADYLKLIENKLQCKFRIVRLDSFEEILEKARYREIDVVNTIINTPERSQYLLFAPPYIQIPNVLVVRYDFKHNITIKDLKGIDGIVYQGGYTIGSVLTQQYGINHAQPITDPVQALRDLSLGRINVMAGNLAVISHYVRQMKLTNLRIAGDCEFDDVISFASRGDWPILNQILVKALREISPEEREAIYDEWIKLEVYRFYQDSRFWFSVIVSLGLFAVILTLFYIWNRALKKQVGNKTLELKQREKALRRSEEKYRCLVENANEAIVVAQDGRLVFVNPIAIELTGYSEQDLTSRPFLDLIHPDDRKMVFERHQQRLKGNLIPSRYSFRMIGKDGNVKYVEISAVLIDWDDRPATLNFITDITERKRMEEALNESKEKYRAAFRTSPDAVNINRLDGLFIDINDGFTQLTGYSREDVIGKYSADIKIWAIPEDRELLMEGLRKNSRVNNLEAKFRCKDGSFKFGLMSASIINLNNIPHILSITRDITEHLRVHEEKAELESQFHQAQKMESVGRLAGGVAHDFNNMLGVILGHAEVALDHVQPSQPLHENLLEIQKAAQRSADLTRQLLSFARKQAISPLILDLNDTIFGMLRMLRRIIGEGIGLIWKPGVNLWPVTMDPTQIDQILVNLAVNARDAIGTVGNLTIETQNIVFDERYCSAHAGFLPGEYIMVNVSDNGCGMDKEVLENLFEPFFTTKEVGKGTGLGLSTIYGIVKQNDGFIKVYSEPGAGTNFKIYFPRKKAVENSKPGAIIEPRSFHGTETVLLVEDEKAILRLGKMILERYGYTVLGAACPDEALTMAKQYQGPIQLIVTDVVMPGVNGKELEDKIAAIHPEIRTLFMSGYTVDVIARHGVIEENFQFLQKPFSVRTLAGKVREVLDQNPPKSL